jgi:hypothetical protein
MKTQHTPGPWEYKGDGYERTNDAGKPRYTLNVWATNPLKHIVEVNADKKGWLDSRAVGNARLIAAAPELKMFCKRALQILETDYANENKSFIGQLKEIIAKAEATS